MAKYTYSYKDSPNLEIGEIFASNDEDAIKIAKEANLYKVFRICYSEGKEISKNIIYKASVG